MKEPIIERKNASMRPCAAVLLLCLLLALAAAPGGAAEVPEPSYQAGQDFVKTCLSLRQSYLVWWKSLSDEERADYNKRWWRDPADEFWDRMEVDFPVPLNAVLTHLGRRNKKQFYDWFHSQDTEKLERKLVGKALDRMEEDFPEAEEAITPLRSAATRLPSGVGENPSRVRLAAYANLCWHAESLEMEKRLAFAEDLADRIYADGTGIAGVPSQANLKGRLGQAADGIREWRGQVGDAVLEHRSVEITVPEPLAEDVRAIQQEVPRYRILSLGVGEIVFAVRDKARGYHWYESFGYWCDSPDDWNIQNHGRLAKMDMRTGEVTDILADPEGGVRDPCVHYDGRKILFSYRPKGTRHYHLYEINADGTGLRQLTDGPFDDIEPIYLPDGDLMFCSSRARRWVPCLNAQVANVYKCEADGSAIRAVNANVETENTPWMMPDGRVLFMRWEYTERDRGFPHNLWTINPDGTGQMTFWGNMNEPDVFIDAKPVPDTNEVIFISHPHGSADHVGAVNILHPDDGPDAHASIQCLTPRFKKNLDRRGYRDPYAVSKDLFLVTTQQKLQVMDREGRRATIWTVRGKDPDIWVHEPRALKGRPREPIIPARTDWRETTGKLILADVTHGRNMAGVEPGAVEKLLVLEILPKPVDHDGHTETISWNGSFFVERVVGTVPVEPDGSAHFEVPAMRPLFFVAMDGDGNAVKRMQSFVSLMPGETTSCVGCHESRTHVSRRHSNLQALSKPAAPIERLEGIPEIFEYVRDVQPILDRHCVQCHNNRDRKGNVVLNDDLGPWFAQSYVTLKCRQQYAAGYGGVGHRGNLEPYSAGAVASPLWKKVQNGHGGVELSQREKDMIFYWIESWAQYAGTYAQLNTDPNKRIYVEKDILKRRCGSCHGDLFRKGHHHAPSGADLREVFGLRVNFSDPEQSLLLRAPLAKEAGGLEICRQKKASDVWAVRTEPNYPLPEMPHEVVFEDKSDPDYRAMLAQIREAAQESLKNRPELGPFTPPARYVREMKRHGVLPEEFELGPQPLQFWFDVDDRYYRLFRPEPLDTRLPGE